MPLTGPYPTHQWVRLAVPSVTWASQGDALSSGEGILRFRFDVDRCETWEVDRVHLFTWGSSPPGDCGYEHEARRERTMHGSGDEDSVNVLLPNPDRYPGWPQDQPDAPAGEPYPMLRIGRYDGSQARVRIFGREDDVFTDDPMGGAIGVFGAYGLRYRNFGAGGSPLTANSSGIFFDTCTGQVDPPSEPQTGDGVWVCIAGGGGPAAYSMTFHLSAAPAAVRRARNLQAYEVLGPERCGAGEPVTWSVSLRNPEPVVSEPYIVNIVEMDEAGRRVNAWYSAPQSAPVPALGATTSIPVPDVRLTHGFHRLAVFARTIGTDPGNMAMAMETTIDCGFSLTDLDQRAVLPVQGTSAPLSAGATPQSRQPSTERPSATPTSPVRGLDGEPSAPTATRSRGGEPEIAVPTATARPRLIPEVEDRLPPPTATPASRGPATGPLLAPTATRPERDAPIRPGR
jgi:hypothetical protein